MAKNPCWFGYLLFYLLFICSHFAGAQIRTALQHTYTDEVGVRELTGHNDGPRVETYLRYCGLLKGEPWCASFVCWSFGQNKISNPRNGFCPNLFTTKKVIYKRTGKHAITPQTGDVWGLYFPEKGRIAHVGFVDEWGDKYVITVEGNTNEAGSREGDGVYKKRRLKTSIYEVASYIN